LAKHGGAREILRRPWEWSREPPIPTESAGKQEKADERERQRRRAKGAIGRLPAPEAPSRECLPNRLRDRQS
jgi:hypothetical protein